MRWLLVALAAGVAGCAERTSTADAARADSSAAGYAVGVHGETSAVVAAAATGAAPADSQRSAAARVATTTATTTTSMVVAPPRENGSSTGKPTPGRDTVKVGTRRPVPDDSSRAPRGDSTTPPVAVAEGPVRVNEFLTYDQRSRTVSLQLIAGYNGLNGSLNYNGATHGSHGLYVPTGWRIHIAVTNRDSDLQHSAIVLHKVLPPPIEPSEPAFPAAALPRLDEGLQEEETGTIDFVADRAGQYMIACGVPGHAQAGMWLQLAVSNGLTVPAYR